MNTLLLLTIILLTIRLGIFIYLHAKHRDFSILKNTVSDYGTGKSRNLYTAMGALSLAAYGAIFLFLLANSFTQQWLIMLLGVAIAGSIAILFFPTDRTGKKTTRTGKIHFILAVLNFTALFVFMANVQIPDAVPHSDFLNIITWIVRITFYAFLATLVIPELRRRYIGLTERLFLTATPLWFIVFAWLLLAR